MGSSAVLEGLALYDNMDSTSTEKGEKIVRDQTHTNWYIGTWMFPSDYLCHKSEVVLEV